MTDNGAARATQRLLEIMARLLGPNGCPWDREQTHRSLVPYLLEESYELAEAIESAAANEDPAAHPTAIAALREELGDVLLQVVFHSQIAQEEGDFDFAQVADGLANKLIERHPHVFARERIDSATQVPDAWDLRKFASRESRLDGIPLALPALMLASKISSRAAKAGFEWRQRDDIYAKAKEELEEFRFAMQSAARMETEHKSEQAKQVMREAAELEFGDLLFSMVQLARWSEVDPERALRRASAKFAQRFRYMEQTMRSQGRDPTTISSDEWWLLWAAAKQAEVQP